MKLTCPACGVKIKSAKPLAPGAKVKCPKCGNRFTISGPSSSPAAPLPSSSSSAPPPQPSSVPPPPVVSSPYEGRDAKGGATKWVVISIALLAVLAGGGIFFVIRGLPGDDAPDKVAAKNEKQTGEQTKKQEKKVEKKNEKPRKQAPLPKGEWASFPHESGDYTAKFPAAPKKSTEKFGPLTYFHQKANIADDETFTVTHFTVGDDVLKKGVDVYLESLVEDFENTRQRMRFIQLGKIPGVEAEWKEKEDDKIVMSVERRYLVGNRVYQIKAQGVEDKFDTKNASKFLDSFQFLSKPDEKVTDRRKGELPVPVADRFDDMKAITRVAFSPKGNFLATFGGVDPTKPTITIWKYPSQLFHCSVESPPSKVDKLAVSPDEQFLAAVGYLELYVWRIKDGRKLHTVSLGKGESAPAASLLQFSADGKQIVTVGDDAGVVLDVAKGKLQKHQPHLGKRPATFAYSPKLHMAVLSYHDPKTKANPMIVWDLKDNGSETVETLEQPIASAAFSRDGTLFAASYAQDEPFVIFRKPAPRNAKKPWPKLKHLVVPTDGFQHYKPLILSDDGKHLAGVPHFAKPVPTKLHLWDLSSPDGAREIDCPDLADVRLAPDGETLVLTFENGPLQFFDIKNGAKKSKPGPPAVLIAQKPKKPAPPKKPQPSKTLVVKLKKTWQKFSAPESGISVFLPTKPELVREGAKDEMTIFATKPKPKDPAKTAFAVAFQPIPEKFRGKPADEQLDKIEEFVRAEFGLGTTVVKRTPIKNRGRTGRELVVRKDADAMYHSRIFAGKTQWSALSMTQAEKKDDPIARKVFFDSIEFGTEPTLPVAKKPQILEGWITFAPKDAGFSVKMPAKPKKVASGGGKKFDVYGAADAKALISFFVRTMPIPKVHREKDVETQYQTVAELLLGKVKYEAIEDKNVKMGDRVGREMVVSIGANQTHIRMIATDKLWLVFHAKTPQVKERPLKVQAFFDSISLESGPAVVPKKP